MSRLMLLSIAFVSLGTAAHAGARCCGGCGCQPCTRKVCKLVCDTKKVPTPVYSVVCEDFCLPGPSIKCKVPCCCPEGCHSGCHNGYKIVYKPTCGKVRTRANLVVGKKEKKVPSYKCVVEEVCCRCGHCAKRTTYPSAGDAPTAMAMAGVEGTNAIATSASPAQGETNDIATAASPAPTESNAASDDAPPVASRNFVDRLFVRK